METTIVEVEVSAALEVSEYHEFVELFLLP